MAIASAEGQTKQQMVDVFNFYLYEEELLQAFNWLGQELNSRDEMKAVLKTLKLRSTKKYYPMS
jgi:hypothetical protein